MSGRETAAETAVASLVVLLLPIQSAHMFSRSIDAGVILAAALSPVMIPAILTVRPAARLVSLLAASAVFGALLVEFSVEGGRTVNRGYEFGIIGLLVAAALVVGAVMWSRRFLSIRMIAAIYGAGALVEGLLSRDLWQGNPWKYAVGWPIAVLVLAAVSDRGRPTQLIALAGLGGLGMAYGHRSFLGFCVITAVLMLIGRGRTSLTVSRGRMAKLALVLVVVGSAVYQAGTHLALTGVFGRETQARTEFALESNSSLIGAGRPEGAAALSLAKARPMGFGPGVLPSKEELDTAKEALASRGVDVRSAYVTDYLFGGHIELHSITADLWVGFGLVGLLLAAYMIFRVFRGLGAQLSAPSVVIVFMAVATLWDLAFSPLSATLLKSTLTFCLLISQREIQRERSSHGLTYRSLPRW